MPFTPFHIGPSALVGAPFQKYLDVPAFILANFAVDVEPLIVLMLRPDYPLHGYCHTLLIGSLVGLFAGILIFLFRPIVSFFMNAILLEYKTTILKAVISSIFGVWFHVFVDSFIYTDIRPLFPSSINPLYGIISSHTLYAICAITTPFGIAVYATIAWNNYITRSKPS